MDIVPAVNPLTVTIPDGSRVQSTHDCKLAIPELPEKAQIGHIVPGLASHSLVSVIKLCNAGCEVTFTKIECTVKYRGRVVLTGYKCQRIGLWMIPLTPNSMETSNPTDHTAQHMWHHQYAQRYAANPSFYQDFAANLIPTSNKEELVRYYHQCLCSPPKSTMLKALRKGWLKTFPGLTYELVSKYLPDSSATDKGHLIRTRKGARSTRSMRQAVLDARENVDDMDPTEQICPALEDQMFCFAMLADQNEDTVYSDLPGRFPVQSYAGNNYIFVAYVYKINSILMRPMKSRSDESMVKAFTDIYAYLKTKIYNQSCTCWTMNVPRRCKRSSKAMAPTSK